MLTDMTRGSLRLALLAGLWVCLGRATAAEPGIFELELRLLGALRPPASAADSGPSLVLDLTRTGERWERVWSVESDSRYAILHAGRVREASVTDTRVTLDLAMEKQNPSRVQVDLKRTADGRLSGTYTVTTPGGTNAGNADGRIKPERPPLPAEYVPVKLSSLT